MEVLKHDGKILVEEENSIQNIAAATKERKGKGPMEQRDCLWWPHGQTPKGLCNNYQEGGG